MIKLPSKHQPADQLLKWISWFCALSVITSFIYLLSDLLISGAASISWDFISSEPEKAGREGGILPMLTSTILLLVLCLLFALPIGIASAVYLAEFTHEKQILPRIIRRGLNMLASVPSIVMGLFGYAFFVIALDMGFSIIAGALTLACMVLPLLIRSVEDSLRSIPIIFRLNARALGLSETRMVISVLLPLASRGILLAIILSVGRAMAETAALLYTAGYVTRMPESVMDSGRSLSVHIFDLSMNVPGGEQNAYASALVLMVLLLMINLSSYQISRKIRNRSFA